MKLNLADVVRILQVGLSGLGFLLAFMGFWLLAREQRTKEPRPAMLRSSKIFLYQCIGLAVIVGLFQLAPEFIPKKLDQEQVGRCRDSFDLLKQRAKTDSLEDMLEVVREHQLKCASIIISLDEGK